MVRRIITTGIILALVACGGSGQVKLDGRQQTVKIKSVASSQDQTQEARIPLPEPVPVEGIVVEVPAAPKEVVESPIVETPVVEAPHTEAPAMDMPKEVAKEAPKPAPAQAPAPAPQGNDKVIPPVLVSGSYLTTATCSWTIKNIRLACTIESSDKTAVLKSRNYRISLRHSKNNAAIVLPEGSIQVVEAGPKLEYTVKFPDPVEDLIVRFDLVSGQSPVLLKEIAPADIDVIIANVTLFEGTDFLGPSKQFGLGKFTQVVSFPEFKRSFSSAKIPLNMAIEICEEIVTGRTCRKYYGDIANFATLAARANTITIYTSMPFISAYIHSGQIGTSGNFGMGIHPLADIDPELQNQITSFHIPNNVLVRACTTPDGSSDCLDYFPGTIDVGVQSDLIKYIEVHPLHQ